MKLLDPNRLWLLVMLVPLLAGYLVLLRVRKRHVVVLPTASFLAVLAPVRRGWRRHVSTATFLLALAVMVIALARPAISHRVPRRLGTVILALDTSNSMRATDVAPTRMVAAREAALRFVQSLPRGVKVGVVTFAASAVVQVSPTFDRIPTERALRLVQTSDGTALGEAVFKAIEVIEADRATASGPATRGRAGLVLLSDGDSTAGRPPGEAAPAVRDARLRLSTISFGTSDGAVLLDGTVVPAPVASNALRNLARDGRGDYFSAASADNLREAYRSISERLGTRIAYREITSWLLLAAIALTVFALAAVAAWAPRVP